MWLLRPELLLSATVLVWTSLLEKKEKYSLQEPPSEQLKHLI